MPAQVRVVRMALLVLSLSVVQAACAPWSREPGSEVSAAWVQAGTNGWVVRALTAAASCPLLHSDRGDFPMRLRAAPGEAAARTDKAQPLTNVARFRERSCEAPVPQGAKALRVARIELRTLPAELRRIVLVGDTGCRMKASESAFQDCRTTDAWPWREVAEAAAELRPDLVVHVGDYHYRESPCPEDRAGCAGSPWGYGEEAWRADLFQPAAKLLTAAPWIFVRGNHESCSRAGVGWMRYLDPEPWSAERSCEDPAHDMKADFTAPYAVEVAPDLRLLVFDSSFSAGKAYRPGDPAASIYAQQLAAIEALVRAGAHHWFANHHPVLGYAGSDDGIPKVGKSGLLSVMKQAYPERYFAEAIEVVLNGHVHQFEALDFSSHHPAELVLGNSGSATEGHVNPGAARQAQPAPGAVVRSFATRSKFGFATLDRDGPAWHLTERTVQGQVVQRCRLSGSKLDCE